MELIDIVHNTVVKKVQSEFDRFYIFEKVLPGKYKIRVRDNDLQRLNVSQEREISLDIASSSDSYSGRDIRLRQRKELPAVSHRD